MSKSAFGKSRATRSDHIVQRTYTMYHGTTLANARKIKREGFIPSPDGMLGRGVYVTRSYKKACAYPRRLKAGQKRAVLRLRVRAGKVKRINRQGHPLQKTWHEEGYDAAWVPPKCGMVKSGLQENCIWDPKRIKVLEVIEQDSSSEESSSSDESVFFEGSSGSSSEDEDSSEEDGSDDGGSDEGGSDEGSSDEGGSDEGSSDEGGSDEDGSEGDCSDEGGSYENSDDEY